MPFLAKIHSEGQKSQCFLQLSQESAWEGETWKLEGSSNYGQATFVYLGDEERGTILSSWLL